MQRSHRSLALLSLLLFDGIAVAVVGIVVVLPLVVVVVVVTP